MINKDSYKHIHCVGIGGVGLSAIADILLSKGIKVSGSDVKENFDTERLRREGAAIHIGHSAENIEGADLLVYSAAIGEDNPEIVAAKERGIPLCSRAKMLGMLMKDCEHSIAVAGTHGKTTTTSMVSLLLKEANLEPTILVGGKLDAINGNVYAGNSEYFVTEACEYMDSFLQLHPTVEIILNIDSDHLDYFKDIEHIAESFKKFVSLVPDDGLIFAYDANPFVHQAIEGRDNVITFGIGDDCDYAAHKIDFDKNGMPKYELWVHGEKKADISLSIPGEYNILNSLAAIACCNTLGVDIETCKETLEKYKGTHRRFDLLGSIKNGVRIVDDYAHHPTEIKATLAASKNVDANRVWCIFQPHTYTRTIALFDDFAKSFGDADEIILAEIYAAREKNMYKISSEELAEAIKKECPDKTIRCFKELEDIADFVYENCQEDDLILTMGAGDIYQVGEMMLERDALEEE